MSMIKLCSDNAELLCNSCLSRNKNAVDFLRNNKERIDWFWFSANPNATTYLLSSPENISKINWQMFSKNNSSKAVEFLLREDNQERIYWSDFCGNTSPLAVRTIINENYTIDWGNFSKNPTAINEIVKEYEKPNHGEIDWFNLALNPKIMVLINKYPEVYEILDKDLLNTNEGAINYLLKEKNRKHININYLSGNTSYEAIEFLKEDENKKYLDWNLISGNPYGIELVTEKLEEENGEYVVNWDELCMNPNAIEILQNEKYKHKINFSLLSINPSIFKGN